MDSFSHKHLQANSSKVRYVIHQGGTRSGKTYSIAFYLLAYAGMHPGSTISIVAESVPHLKRGVLKDIRQIIQERKWEKFIKEKQTDHRFVFFNHSEIECFSADEDSKLRGAKRDILFINECNNVTKKSFDELDVRTRFKCILDYNPVKRFWVHDYLIPMLSNQDIERSRNAVSTTLNHQRYVFLKSTYRDNYYLSSEEIENIEMRKNNVTWWQVYGEGEVGVAEGLIFSNWDITETCDIGKLIGYGIDFGFTHSCTAVVKVMESEGELYVKEMLYRRNISNDDIFEALKPHINMYDLAVADNNEPKTITYLYKLGWKGIQASIKGPDSVIYGLNLLLDRKIHIDKDSVNLINEFKNYVWDTNHDGARINRPLKEFDHGIDALRYLISYPPKKILAIA